MPLLVPMFVGIGFTFIVYINYPELAIILTLGGILGLQFYQTLLQEKIAEISKENKR
ncbi:hypothetical protein [Shouchella patagoniensis]|uniref:hypothetical protein n=1 Tax=Shouchella patagoniensis TaxID=228576 RepID=UPI001473500F|nr:hypothetical protein [Shouchella patagoniensis]